MRFSSRTWMVISAVLLLAAAYCAKLGNDARQRERVPGASVAQPAKIRPTSQLGVRPHLFPLLTASAASQSASARSASQPVDSKFPLRLRNTVQSLRDLQRSDSAILLRNALIDTHSAAEIEVPSTLKAADDAGSYLVQARGAIDEFFRAQIREVNGEVVAYIPNNAYLVRMDASQAQAMKERSRVQSVLPFHPYYKLDYNLLSKALEPQEADERMGLRVGLFPSSVASARTALEAVGAHVGEVERSPFGPVMAVDASASQLATIASLREVQAVEAAHERVAMNDRTRVRLGISPDSTSTTNDYLGLTGTNVWVNVNDTGIDRSHADLAGRVFGLNAAVFNDPEGHGTHVAGVIAGSGISSTNVTELPQGSSEGGHFRGMAPGAKLFALPVSLITGPAISDTFLQETAAMTNYVLLKKTTPMISNNSWGYPASKDYDLSAASYDAAVRDALPEVSGSQPMIYVFAAGNQGFGNSDGSGGEPDSLVSPATAKNVITVGALESRREFTNQVRTPDPLDPNRFTTNTIFKEASNSDDEVANYSSRGNVGIGQEGTRGRFKPDLVAPGSFVVSTRSSTWSDPVNGKTPSVARFPGQLVSASGTNDYSVFLPDNVFSFEIRIVSNPASPSPFPALPVYLAAGRSVTGGDFLKDGNVTLPGDAALPRGLLNFSIGNRSGQAVAYDLVTVLTTTNAVGDYYVELKKLNNGLAPKYRYDSGTSVSAASVSGMLALMQQFFESNKVSYTPALMKALLINGARSVNSVYDLQVQNNINYQGWGQPQLQNVLSSGVISNLNKTIPVNFVDSGATNALATGESVTWKLDLPADAGLDFPLRATLVWTDPPGNPNAGIKLVNDLDLVVSNVTSKAFYYGNFIQEGSDFTTPIPVGSTNGLSLADYTDVVNNVENVVIPAPDGLNFEVTVTAKRVNVNAVTGHPKGIVQDFALVVSCGGRPVRLVPVAKPEPFRPPIGYPTNGLPMMNQRAGANSPLEGGSSVPNNGVASQWSFFVFTNAFFTNQPFSSTLTNGQNVAFITFVPPNLSKPRNLDADIDLFVSRNPAITNLDSAALAAADRSRGRGGTETVVYTNAPVGADAVFYVAVKSEDQQGAEFALVALSSNEPFERFDANGNRVLRGMPAGLPLPDGSPSQPAGAYMFAVGVTPSIVQGVRASLLVDHGNFGDLIGNLSHDRHFAVLNNHNSDADVLGPLHSLLYDDSDSGTTIGSRRTDGPGSLRSFDATPSSGAWILSMVDNQLSHTGTIQGFELIVEPALLVSSGGVDAAVLANRFKTFFVDVPADASRLDVLLSKATSPLRVYLRREAQPTVDDYDKFASFNAPGGTLSLGIRDVPPLVAGRYYIGVYNPGVATVNFTLQTRIDHGLTQGFAKSPTDTAGKALTDDVVQYATNLVDDARPITDVKVGVRIEAARLSDLALRLISPQGKSVLLMENRGGVDTQEIGGQSVTTNFHHVALTYDRSNGVAALYLDGEKTGEKSVGSFAVDTRDDVFLGRQPLTNSYSAPFVGVMDEVGIYSRALFPSEIRAIHRFGSVGRATNGLAAQWSFETDGADRFGKVPLSIFGAQFVSGREGYGLNFPQETYARTTNQGGVNVGAGAGFTVDLWINPLDLTTNRTLVLWSDGTNRVGTSLSIVPGSAAGVQPGVLSATLVGLDNTNRVITMDLPGMIRTNSIATNFVFAVFNEDTNIAQVPIKFATVPYVTNALATNRYLGGFEVALTNVNTVFGTGRLVDGWSVVSNELNVLGMPSLAQTGTNFAALGRGRIAKALDTVDGHRYELRFVHRHQPDFDGVAAWWKGEDSAADLIGFSPGTASVDTAYTNAVVGKGFLFPKPGASVVVPDNATLRLTNELTVEFWFNRLSAATTSGSLLAKQTETKGAVKGRANYGVDFHPTLGLGFWFDDPAVNTTAQSDDFNVSSLESVRLGSLPSAGVFHHFVGTFKQSGTGTVEGRIYLDGKLAKSKVLPGSLANSVSDAPVVLGSLATNLASYAVILDEPTVFARAVSEQEVALIYTLANLGKCQYPCTPETAIQFGANTAQTFTSGSDWATNTFSFTASGSSTALSLSAVTAGALLDSFEMKEVFSHDFLPEEPMQDLLGGSGLGAWRLELTDSRVGPTPSVPASRLLAWQLQLTFAPTNYSAVTLRDGVTYSNQIGAGQTLFFIAEPPRSATRATNTLVAGAPVDLQFNQDGLPLQSVGDLTLLTSVTNGISVISTNGTWQLDTNNAASNLSGLPKLAPGQRYYMGVRNSGPATSLLLRVDYDRTDPAITGLTLLSKGQLVSTNIAVTNALQYYSYTVSSNATTATFSVFPTNGNVNLYVRKAVRSVAPLPTPNNYDYASAKTGTEPEIIVVTADSPVPLTAGEWYLGVQNADTNRVTYSIRVDESTSSGPSTNIVQLFNAQPVSSVSGASAGINQVYLYVAPPGVTKMLFELFDLSGNLDLLARRGAVPTLAEFDASSKNAGVADEQILLTPSSISVPLEGDWYLAVVNSGAQPSSYSISASSASVGVLLSGKPTRLAVNPVIAPDGKVSLAWNSIPGERYRLDTSSDLVAWKQVKIITATGSTVQTDDLPAGTSTTVFYRIVQIP